MVATFAEALKFFLPKREQLFEFCSSVEACIVVALFDAIDYVNGEIRSAEREPISLERFVAVGSMVELKASAVHRAFDVKVAGDIDAAARLVANGEDTR